MKTTARKSLLGQAISSGLVIGRIAKIRRSPAGPHVPLVVQSPDQEWQKYSDAQKKALAQVEELRAEEKSGLVKQNSAERDNQNDNTFPEIMTSYSYVLKDELLTERIKTSVFKDSLDATSAILQAFRDVRAVVASMDDLYIREKVLDLDACEELLLSALSDTKDHHGHEWSHLSGRIVVASHLSPQDIIRLQQVGVAGIVTEHGSQLSHAAILVKSFNIPTIFCAEGIIRASSNGQLAILDANEGKITTQPSRSELRKAEARRAVELMVQHKLKAAAQMIARSTDGHRVIVFANADGPIDSRAVVASGAEGIGLLRTEFLHLTAEHYENRQTTIEEQLSVFFRLTSEALAPRWVTFRLLDCGGDKPYPANNELGIPEKGNQSQGLFGLRGVRFLIAEKEILKLQLRALIRANTAGNIRILAPFVCDVQEIRQIKSVIQSIWLEMTEDEKASLHYPSIGAMIETPAAVQIIDILSAECDFLSIGSNDLTQHYLCVERENPKTLGLFNSYHPAVLRCLKSVFEHQKNIDVGISLCGEIASDPVATELLLGLGCHQFSCRPVSIPLIKEIIRKTNLEDACHFADSILRLGSTEEIQQRVEQRYEERYGRTTFSKTSKNRAS